MLGVNRTRMMLVASLLVLVAAGAAGGWLVMSGDSSANAISPRPQPRESPQPGAMATLPEGAFTRGRAGGGYEAQPPRQIEMSAFAIDTCEVTNERFAEFVEATGYETTAERQGFGRVFVQAERKVVEAPGAYWRRPEGVDSTIVGREQNPVVQVSWNDAQAYVQWAGKRLPTEAEFEYAARGGLADYDYAWRPSGMQWKDRWLANIWQGEFPQRPETLDGFPRTAPVARYPANPWGLFDMLGNVREWCHDPYASDYYQVSPARDPKGPVDGPTRTVRGGSWLSPQATQEATVWRRMHLHPQWCDDQTGFRCVQSAPDATPPGELTPSGEPIRRLTQ